MLIWIISLEIGFTGDFYAKFGFYIAEFSTAAAYGIAIHHTIFHRLFEAKEDFSLIP
jgi:hypothetical protein